MSETKTKPTARVYVRLKEGVLDPEGVTIQKALARMGFDRAASVRTGKYFEVELADDSPESHEQLQSLSEKVLANPVIQTFQIDWLKKK